MPKSIESDKNASFLKVRIQPNASRNQIVGWHGGALKIRIQSPAVEGAANRQCIKFLAASMEISKNSVWIAKGEKSRLKLVGLKTLTDEEVRSKVSHLLGSNVQDKR